MLDDLLQHLGLGAFSLRGFGPLLLQALVAQDMFLAGTIVLLLGVMTVVGTLISDLLLMWIEPRLRITGR